VKFFLAAVLFCVTTGFSQAQQDSILCFPVGALESQAEKHGEYPAFSFKDAQYNITFTMYINPVTGTYTLLGVSDLNREVECVASIGSDFKPAVYKPEGVDS
tara:strand:- start:126 stop:431 length:306 start_codon:yes stop_codon:yes gene_type:complete